MKSRFGGTQYAKVILDSLWGLPPGLDMPYEKRVQQAIREIVAAKLANAAHDISDGGLAIALCESSFGPAGIGARVDLPAVMRPEFLLFHEGPSRIVVATSQPENVVEIARKNSVEALAYRCYDERAVTNRLRFENFAGLRPDGVEATLGNFTRTPAAPAVAEIQPTAPAVAEIQNDKLREECGVFAIHGHPEAANLAYLGLYALQHRGQESAGIATSDHREIRCSKSMGHVADIFTPEQIASLPGDMAIGHTRYSTAGDTVLAERAAVSGGVQQRADRGGAQRQHHQCRRTEARPGARRIHLSSHQRYRSDSASGGAIARTNTRGRAARSPAAIGRRVFAGVPGQGPRDCGARSAWIPSAGLWTHACDRRRHGLRFRVGNLRVRFDQLPTM